MFTFNYKKQFADRVACGVKRQTIRAFRRDGKLPKPGEALRHYTGLRTKYSRKLLDTVCRDVHAVQITDSEIVVGGVRLSMNDADALAWADGFASTAEFVEFFRNQHGLPFEGFLTRW